MADQCLPCRDICDCLTFTSSDDTIIVTRTNCTIDVKIDPDAIVPVEADPTPVNAGAGITVTGNGTSGTPWHIVNTGVLTVNGQSGNVTVPTYNGSETKVTAGTGISVAGVGTIGSPYIITNTLTLPTPPDGSETKVTVMTPGLSISGTGTISTPYILTNTGVTSVNGITGAVTVPVYNGSETKVISGPGITVTGIGTVVNPYVVSANAGGTSSCAATIIPYEDAECCKTLDAAIVFSNGLVATNNEDDCQIDVTIDVLRSCSISWSAGFTALTGGSKVGAQFVYKKNIFAKFRGYMVYVAGSGVSTTPTLFATILSCGYPDNVGVAYPSGQITREFYVNGTNGSGTVFLFVVSTDSAGKFYVRASGASDFASGTYTINLEPVNYEIA